MPTGPSSSDTPYLLPVAPGVSLTSILTTGDTVGGYKMAGIPDGLGAFDNGDGTFTLLMNHEIGTTGNPPAPLGAVRAHGSAGAFVSKWVIKKSDLSVVSGGDLIQSVYLWNPTTNSFDQGTTAFSRFCSADLASINAFYNSATGLGTVARIFLNGEENGTEGRAFAHIATGANAGKTYQLPFLGKFGWENAVASPITSDKTIVAGLDDGPGGQVYFYVGTKTNTGTDIDKAGLNNGKVFGVKIAGLSAENRTAPPTPGTRFGLFDLGSVENTTGTALDSASVAAGVTTFLRPEDGAWDPSSPRDFYFNTTDRIDQVSDGVGTQVGNSRVWRLRFDDLNDLSKGGTVEAVVDGITDKDANGNPVKVNMLDNMTIDRYGHITLLEDVGNNAHSGKVWQYDIATDRLTQVARFDPARFGDIGVAPTAPFNVDEESSGVIDMQDILGSGWYLLDAQAHYPTTTELVEGGQLLALYNPTTLNAYAQAKDKVAFSAIAAGDATNNSEILWTRTVDKNTKQGILANLTVQVSTDSNFSTISRSYSAISDPNRDYTVKVDATGLQSNTRYYYRFQTSGGDISPVGTFKTAPTASTQAAVRFGFSGDADGQWRPYISTQNFKNLKLDFFGFLGDTIYETASTGSAATANAVTNPTQALIDYQRKYLENLQPTSKNGFSSLATLFASQGNYTLLDNHELGNKQLINGGAPSALAPNSGNGSSDPANDVNTTGTFINDTVGFKTLVQAYSNYQPIREKIVSAPGDARTDGTQQLYLAQQWGKNLVYINTDTRSYRDVRLKTAGGADDTGIRASNPDRTMLGATQLAWLKQTLLDAQTNGTVWKFVSVSDPIDQIGAIGSGLDGGKSWMGGYRAERNDLLKFIADNSIKNVVFLSTDDHQNRVNELTYWENPADINDQSKAKVLSNVLSVVDGPIGAGGPDTITDHSFANLKNLADGLVASQIAANVNPIGLDPNFAGLKNVKREGDPNANTLRQAIDFFSPDTFNYTVFDISADGKTLNVNVQGVDSYAANTFPERNATNRVRSLVSFGLDASLTLNGTSGNDVLKGAEANDVINGLAGNDVLQGFGSNDILDGGSDDDILSGGNGDDLLKGGSGKDKLYGETGNDTLVGGLDKDVLLGGVGNDTLIGGLDKDWSVGGVGNDRFDYQNLGDSLLSSYDTIADFDVNEDKLLVATAPTVFTDGLTVTGLTETAIGAKLTSANFVNDQYAALFKYGNRTFVAINDAIAGFQAGSDAIVELNTSKLNGVFGSGNFVVA